MPDYNVNDKGFPTSSHKWDEQFFVKGERLGLPPEASLVARLAQLTAAIEDEKNINERARGGWVREKAWRLSQLEQVRRRDVSDPEPEV